MFRTIFFDKIEFKKTFKTSGTVPEVLGVQMNDIFFPILFYSKI